MRFLSDSEKDVYLKQFVDDESGLGKKIGDYEDEKGNNIFTENWVDASGNDRAPIAPDKDFALFFNSRSFLMGVKVEF